MILTEIVRKYLDQSVLCWLATTDEQGQPNVSPKEIFTYHGDVILIANIASPNSVRNIKQNAKVALSFIDILLQKGFQVHGEAIVFNAKDEEYIQYAKKLIPLVGDKFKMLGIIRIKPTKVRPILAPSYQFYSETTSEEKQVEAARLLYGL